MLASLLAPRFVSFPQLQPAIMVLKGLARLASRHSTQHPHHLGRSKTRGLAVVAGCAVLVLAAMWLQQGDLVRYTVLQHCLPPLLHCLPPHLLAWANFELLQAVFLVL